MRRTLLFLLGILSVPAAAPGQTVHILNADEKFHAAPAGVLLGTISAGTSIQPGTRRDTWREATLEGWIWAPSVRADGRPGFDLVVSARSGENLRAAPNGEVMARLVSGALLVQKKRDGQWVQVRRTGWIRDAAIPGDDQPVATKGATTRGTAARTPNNLAPDTGNLSARSPAASAPAAGSIAWTGQAGSRVLNAPAGDTLATIRPLAAVEVLERQGDWARIRVEGWAWAPALGSPADSGAVLTGLAPEVLLSNPDRFRGRILEWEVQFIALERAEKLRADFTEGEPFILARPPGDQPGFVYIAVPETQRARIQELIPLQRITVLARVRNGRSTQMSAPILELLELH